MRENESAMANKVEDVHSIYTLTPALSLRERGKRYS